MSNTISAVRAEDFVQSIGVNTNISWTDPAYSWSNSANIVADVAYLGISHIRDSAPLPWTLSIYQTLAAAGVKFDFLVESGALNLTADITRANSLAATNPGSIAAIEGPDEVNLIPIAYNGVSSTTSLYVGTVVQSALYSLVHSDPLLAGVQVYDLTLGVASPAQYNSLGNIASFADYGNWHTYFSNGIPPGAKIAAEAALAKATTPGKPIVLTETGYYTAPLMTNWGGVNQDVQAKQTLDDLLDAYQDGYSATYIYQLMDNFNNPGPYDREDSFGLFNGDGSPKEAAVAIHDLVAILADTTSNAQSFTTGTLAYSLGNLPSTGNSLLMQKSSGAYDLVVWNEAVIWNEATTSQIYIPNTNVTVNLGATFQSVLVYDPLQGTSPIAGYSNVSSLVIGLSDHPLIIQVSGPAAVVSAARALTVTSSAVTSGAITSTGADVINTSGNATVNASANATITGGSGILAVVLTGSGASVTGGSGNLTVFDAHGGNTVVTGTGTNTVTVVGGNDQITANSWTNAITLGSGSSTVSVFGDAQIIGGSGNAVINAQGSWINATTGAGTNKVNFLAGAGYVQTNGTDVVDASSSAGGRISVDAEGPSTSVTGGSGGIWFSGNGNATVTTGHSGTSTFSPGAGNDMFATWGNTTNEFFLGSGNAWISSTGADIVHNGSGHDTVFQTGAGAQSLLVYGSNTGVLLTAGAGNTTLVGANGADTVIGGSGSMLVQAGSGATSVQFAQGNSTVAVGNGSPDTMIFQNGQGGGYDVIQNFRPSVDHLHLSGYSANQAQNAVSSGSATAAGFTMKLSDGTTIVMAGLTQFSSSSFT